MIDFEEVKQGGLEVVNVDRIVHYVKTEVIGLSVVGAGPTPAPATQMEKA